MAVTNFLREVWAKRIQDDLEKKCKLVPNCNTAYEGECEYAKSVRILGVGEPTINKYTGDKIETEDMSDKSVILTIDQQYYFSFYVKDVDKAQSQPGLAAKYQAKAVHGLALKRDSYVADLISQAINVTEIAELTEEAIGDGIDEGIVELRQRDFDEEGVIEITPKVYNKFKKRLITLSTDNPEYIKKGKVGVYDDFDVIMSNNMKNDGEYTYCDIRGRDAIAFAGQINEVEALRSENYFSDIIRGLDTFGAKIVDENRIQVLKVTNPV